jgi:hypothetical protein
MVKLEPRSERVLFAPLIWRLAMKTEQVPWSDMATSATEAVYVLRSAQRLFKQDIHCVSFDTWMEAEAAGSKIERDDLGMPVGRPAPIADLRPVEDVLSAQPITRTVEILRRLALEPGPGIVPVATMTAPATLQNRIGRDATSLSAADDRLDYVRQIMLGLIRLYCEAGAGALLFLEEEASDDFAELTEFTALFNLAEYFATPVFLLSRQRIRPDGLSLVSSLGASYLTPDETTDGIVALPPADGSARADNSWLAMSRWEIDPETDPNTLQDWRKNLSRA